MPYLLLLKYKACIINIFDEHNAGGGQQIPIFAALGAECYVLDYSSLQIESEKLVAKREGYSVNTVEADMTKPLPFENDFFDIIVSLLQIVI